jgi:hypothetical protein
MNVKEQVILFLLIYIQYIYFFCYSRVLNDDLYLNRMVNNMASTGNDFVQRTRLLEERIIDPRSSISIDSLLDSIVALIYDCEGLKKTKNFDTFYGKCKKKKIFFLILFIII